MAKLKKEYTCALILSNDLIGGKWKLQILWHIIHGDNRFSLLIKAIPNITQKVLTSQLKELEQSGIIIRHVIDDNPPKTIVYEISEEESELSSVIDDICNYTKKYAGRSNIMIPE